MNKEERNIPLNTLLQDYCKVKPPYEFKVELEEKRMKSRNTKIFTAVACAALVLVCAVAFVAGFSDKLITDKTADDLGFVINARAQGATEDSAEVLTFKNTKINTELPLITKGYDKSSRSLGFQHIALEISGDDVVRYDIKAEHGILHLHDNLYRLGEKNVAEGGKYFDYYVFGDELFDLPADAKETYLFWLPDFDKLNADAQTFEQQCELLQTAEDYNKYFADTITLTVEYKDGSYQSVEIFISFDSEAYAYASISERNDVVDVYF